MTRLGIVVAMAAEARAFGLRRHEVGAIVALTDQVLVCISGIGRVRTLAAGERLLAHGANALLSWGTAVAIDGELAAGHLLLPRTVLDAQRRSAPVSIDWQQRLRGRLGSCFPLTDDPLITADCVLTNPLHKRHLHAESGAVAADMESAALADLARNAGVPFLVLRVIADTVDTRVPAWIGDKIDDFGRARLASMLPSLMMHPTDWPDLVRLVRDFRAALNTLQAILKHVTFGDLKPANTAAGNRIVTID